MNGLDGPVRIYRDAYGIAHVVADSERDAIFATGFLHAQERLFQMDLIRRAAAGRLAELLGVVAVGWDRRARRQGHHAAAADALGRLETAARELLAAYTDGVNAAVATGRALPPEYVVLRVGFAPWRPVDVILAIRAMQERLSTSSSELTRYRLARRAGLAGARFLLDSRPAAVAIILAGTEDPPAGETTRALLLEEATRLGLPLEPPVVPPVSSGARLAGARPGIAFGGLADEVPAIGSNSWVVGPARSASGAALLANDTHLGLEMPATFYLIDLEWSGHRVAGATVPGFPGVVIGRNRRIAWGVTILTADNVDYAVERVDPDDGDFYLNAAAEGGRERFLRHTETIRVKGGEPVEETIVRTRHGVVVDPEWGEHEVLVRSRPHPVGLSAIDAVLHYARAGNFEAFHAAALRHDLPTQNLVYADVDGHIGYVAAGAIPRREGRTGLLPAAGWLAARLFNGWDDAADRPVAHDPPDGLVVTANNRVLPGGRGDLWNRSWIRADRATRAHALLEATGRHDLDSFRRMQGDTASRRAALALDGLAARLADGTWALDSEDSGEDARRCWEILSAWDRRYERGPAPGLFALFWKELKSGVFADDVGADLAGATDAGLLRILLPERFMESPPGPLDGRRWWDDLGTPGLEERPATVIGRALEAAWRGMVERAGDRPEGWDWPALHRVRFVHPLGRLPLLDRLFNGPDVPVPGAGGCLFATAFRTPSFDVVALPAMRMLADLSPGGGLRMVLPSGQSGVPPSRHYADLAPLWAAVQGIPLFIPPAEREAAGEVLLLEPMP